ncbi:sarcosine oxidase subunit gamma [Rhodovulum sp. YNF3179]|uniref:sarcosine oxidase subunit gamma n=1 Tax=Rhodovulum sp. YNF3179 TaxID=3425127 RepID=UPI003D347510
MSEAVSALNGAEYKGAVTVTERGLAGMVTVRGDLSSAALAAAIQDVIGTDVPGRRRIEVAGDHAAAWMSPDELLLMMPYAAAPQAAAKIAEALAGEAALVVNVSDARALFRIEGPGVRDVLAKGAPVDLSPGAFGAGEIRRTRIGQVAAAFWLTGADSFDIVCFRSVAEYVFDWLSTGAAEDSLPGWYA